MSANDKREEFIKKYWGERADVPDNAIGDTFPAIAIPSYITEYKSENKDKYPDCVNLRSSLQKSDLSSDELPSYTFPVWYSPTSGKIYLFAKAYKDRLGNNALEDNPWMIFPNLSNFINAISPTNRSDKTGFTSNCLYRLDDKFNPIEKNGKYVRWADDEKNPKKGDQNPPQPNGKTIMDNNKILNEKNIILYGAPGTGKTYSSIMYAVGIIEEKSFRTIKNEKYEDVFTRYNNYKKEGLIEFTTFHQSFGYEEFIEGIRPQIENSTDNGDIEYELHSGIFKAFCDNAAIPIANNPNDDLGIGKNPTVWKVSLMGTGDNEVRRDCMANNYIRIGWDDYDDKNPNNNDGKMPKPLNAFYEMQKGDIVMSCFSQRTIDAIGVITGDADVMSTPQPYKRIRKVKWLIKGIDEDIFNINGGKSMTRSPVYRLLVPINDVIQILKKKAPQLFAANAKIKNRVFIIDEINRGNISKIFGELITLIEPSKRIGANEEMRAKLPYSGIDFGVPENVYVIGTMNTADRSIAMIDTALRRRFHFVEMPPEAKLLADIKVGEIKIGELLDTINKRITVLLDREHVIGHSYLLPLAKEKNNNIETLAEIFAHKIIPLLQEYFHDDYEKIRLVLGDNQKTNSDEHFIKAEKADAGKLFGEKDRDAVDEDGKIYEINSKAFTNPVAYAFIK